ncbi:DUF3048 domain-containing protein [Cytobacillus spongiae]|uniref:DUF3048 domain-containing protein n=1 Tax=Cytobacillus spongiae TaxID=2901381 RepID=UPI001F1E9EDA|nr:DUF3048 domain-containing protein [Cytobacillus spongiae]UII56344.1 DUF3048 domain-containing protein [Cytobacillus spongiae]
MYKKWLGVSAVALLLLSGCSGKEDVQPKEESSEEVVKKVEADTEYTNHFPLTGVGTNEDFGGRAVAVMINNDPKARPQSGLHQADIIYELLAEGNITRFLAIFQSEQPEKVGPVRSSRDYYIDLAKGYNSLYIAHGWSPEAKEMLTSGYIDNINGMEYDGSLFERASFRQAPHNSYITFENIIKGAKENDYEMKSPPASLTFLTEKEVKALQGTEAKSIMISYFSNALFHLTYEYDEELEKYKRYTNGELTNDMESEEPVLIDNLFIVEMEHEIIDASGRREINLTSGGKGYLIQKGKRNEVDWKNVDGKIIPFANGKEVGLTQGKTWINVVPTSPGIDQMVSIE